MAQPVETATDHRHTHKYLGLIMVNLKSVYRRTDRRTDGRTLPNVLSPFASRLIVKFNFTHNFILLFLLFTGQIWHI